MKTALAFVLMGFFLLPQAGAAPNDEERVAFFSEQRNKRAQFEREALEQTDSKTAAVQQFNAKSQAERTTFQRSLVELPEGERQERLIEFNEAARQNQRVFRQKLPTLPKNALEKSLGDFDKKAASDLSGLVAQLADADPAFRAETMRLSQNEFRLRRAQLQTAAQRDIQEKKRRFSLDQAREAREFMAAE